MKNKILIALAVVLLLPCQRGFAADKEADAAIQQRLEWNLRTLVDAYEKEGKIDSKWNEPARRALTAYARARCRILNTNENLDLIIATNCETAMAAGCSDPMIRYLYLRSSSTGSVGTNKVKLAEDWVEMAEKMEKSSYPGIRKFYASVRAIAQMDYATNTQYAVLSSTTEAFRTNNQVVKNIRAVLEDKTTPPDEVYEVCHEILDRLKRNETQYKTWYRNIEHSVFDTWPSNSVSWLLKGEANIQMAWHARGNGFANTVTEEGWKLFRERLTVAENALTNAWQLNPKDPRIAVKMIWLELGQGEGMDRMELWFHRAMKLDSNNYDACNTKLLYLEPKWYGSTKEMLDWGRKCVQTKEWGDQIPLVLVNAHYDIAHQFDNSGEAYWKRPDVWADIKAAFDRFFKLNPDAIGWYHSYAWYAYHCEQWDKLNELIPKLGPVNYDYFGGNAEFDKMIRLAKEHTTKH